MAFAFLALLFNVLVDPYGANPLRIRFARPLMDINQRFMYPQVLRSGEFDSAIFGTSTVRLLKPSDLEARFGGNFANFGMNAATSFEQSEAVRLFLAHTPGVRTLIWGIDRLWCRPDAETADSLSPERAFPPWLFDDSRWTTIPHLFNLRTLEISARVVMNKLGLMQPRLPRNGYDVFTPSEARYDLARARAHIWSDGPPRAASGEAQIEATQAERSSWRYPALDRLSATLADLPKTARLLVLHPPVHIAVQPVPGTLDAAHDAECKRRVASIVAAHQGVTVDMSLVSPITREDENYWDAMHYRLPIAKQIAEILHRASIGERGDETFHVLGQGS
jgi:hypothetical protein